MRVLALHGKGGSGAQFARVLRPLSEVLTECEFVCPDAPHEGRVWWTIEPTGARSFEADAFSGVSESFAVLQQAAANEPFDAVIGHSQGGMLGAVLVAQRALRFGRSRKILRADAPGIFSGAAVPKPYGELFARVVDERPPLPPTVHCIGDADEIIPPAESARLAEAMEPNAMVINHDGGHVTPLDTQAVERLAAVLRRAGADGIMQRRPAAQGPPPTTTVVAKTGSVHGVALKAILFELVERHGWEALARAVPIRCFYHEPTITSSLRFLRKTDWARERVERLYLETCMGTEGGGRRAPRGRTGPEGAMTTGGRTGSGGRSEPRRPAQQPPTSTTSGAAKRREMRG